MSLSLASTSASSFALASFVSVALLNSKSSRDERFTTAGFFGSGFATGAGLISGVTCGFGAGVGAGSGAGLGASCVAQPAARSAARMNERFFIGFSLGDFWCRI